jgi:hypothetical protein
MKSSILIVAILALAGCASFQPTINGVENAALTNVRAAEDNNIRVWTTDACGTPYSAAIRNPQIVPALMALCLPNGDATNPANLLNGIPNKP